MPLRTTGTLCRSMKMSLNEVKSNYYVNTKPSTMNEREPKNLDLNNDSDNDQYGSDNENSSQMTVFKQIFKKYKKRKPLPDLSQVIDTRNGSPELSTISVPNLPSYDKVSEEHFDLLGLKPLKEWNIMTLADRPGLYLIPNIIREDGLLLWLKRVFQYAESPSRTNLTLHGTSPEKNVLAEAGKKLRWTTLGIEYDWSSKEYPETGRAVPEELVLMGEVISQVLGLSKMKPDATIINYYPPKTALSPHVDKSERSSAPLVSMSLGQSAIYLSGGLSLDDPVVPIWLRAGDILVMYADQRLVYHAIPCIVRTRDYCFPEKDKLLEEYANESRINMTIRQVNS